MTAPQSATAKLGSAEPEKRSAAVPMGIASDHSDIEAGPTPPAEAEVFTNAEDPQSADADPAPPGVVSTEAASGIRWKWLLTYGLLPGLALLLAVAAAYLKDQVGCVSESGIARIESVAAAKESTIALLSYTAETAEKDLGAARDRTTGTFSEAYTQLIHDVVIPGARQKHISAVAKVPAAASVSATPNHAVALVFIDQTVVIGTDPPTDTASSVRVTLEKVGGRWLISGFDPV